MHSKKQTLNNIRLELVSKYVPSPQVASLPQFQSALIKALLYFDVFNYPLTKNEIREYANARICEEEAEDVLLHLLSSGLISKTKEFYHLNKRQEIVTARLRMNKTALSYIPKAGKFSRIISWFPFVEAVFITGSLSKNCMNEAGDIDYLIITRPGRLWISRATITAFKKIFLLNSRKYFCVNYYVDADSLAIPDQNIFTATEIVFAKPAYSPEVCAQFFENNKWAQTYYPNKQLPDLSFASTVNQSTTKQLLEKVLTGWVGEKLDSLFFKIFINRWRKKFPNQTDDSFEINFRSRKNVSKHHPNGFQFKVLQQYDERIKQFETEHNLSLK